MSNTKKEIYMSTNGYFSHELCDRLLADAATALEYREKHLSIKKVIFNCPATIVLWADGTKTVVKSGDYDVFDPEKGLSMAIAKKALGNRGNYYNTFRKHLPKEDGISIDVRGCDTDPFRLLGETIKRCLTETGLIGADKGGNDDKTE